MNKKPLKLLVAVLCGILPLGLISCGVNPNGVHGTELLKLTDDELYEKVYLQTLDIVESVKG